MNRRDAIKSALAVWAASASVGYIGCTRVTGEGDRFTGAVLATVESIADVLIPDTSVPGAKAAGVGPFIVMMVQDCYPQDVQESFLSGIRQVERSSNEEFGQSFSKIARTDQEEILDRIQRNPDDPHQAFYKLIRELCFLGYFTSEIGATRALEYVPVPGKYEGCVPYVKGQRAWII